MHEIRFSWGVLAVVCALTGCSNSNDSTAAQTPGGTSTLPTVGAAGTTSAGSPASAANGGSGAKAAVGGSGAATAPSTAGGGTTISTAGTAAAAGLAGMSGSSSAGMAAVAGASGATRSATAGSGGMMASMAGAGGATNAGSGAQAGGIMGCGNTKLLAAPDDTSMRGPWAVGEKTVKFGRFTAVEIFYPAQPGSDKGKDPLKQDFREFLPMSERMKVPDAEATIASAGTYRDLPIDADHGPYPVVIMVHGTASFRLGSWSTQALWASRGFVVVAGDHPNLYLADYLAGNGCGQTAPALDLSGDVDSEIQALVTPTGDLMFLSGHLDMTRLGLAGHSAGAYNVAQFSSKPNVQLVMPLAGTHSVDMSSTLKEVLFVSGIADSVLSYKPPQSGVGGLLYPGTDTDAYTASPGPPAVKKRLVGITGGGHLVVTDLCHKNAQGMSDLDVANAHGVCGASNLIALNLADCGTVDPDKGIQVVNDVTTSALEETLTCQNRDARWSGLMMRDSLVGDFHEAVK